MMTDREIKAISETMTYMTTMVLELKREIKEMRETAAPTDFQVIEQERVKFNVKLDKLNAKASKFEADRRVLRRTINKVRRENAALHREMSEAVAARDMSDLMLKTANKELNQLREKVAKLEAMKELKLAVVKEFQRLIPDGPTPEERQWRDHEKKMVAIERR